MFENALSDATVALTMSAVMVGIFNTPQVSIEPKKGRKIEGRAVSFAVTSGLLFGCFQFVNALTSNH